MQILTHHPHGIVAIDTGFHRPAFDAAWLIVEDGRAAFVDVGTNHSVPRLLAALADAGLGVEAVDHVIVTHVHLDHAGGAGALMHELPNARLTVHPRGARHMIDPAQLVAGATAVYGEAEMRRSYGVLVPVPAARVDEAPDGHVVMLSARPLVCLDTPGHARHHFCVWDARSRGVFSGDTFGLSYRELDSANGAFVLPTTSPVQFEPEALKASIARLLALDPQAVYLTHFGRVDDVARLGRDMIEQVDAMVAIARDCDGRDDRHARLVEGLAGLYVGRARAHGCALGDDEVRALLGVDIELNADRKSVV